MTTISRRRGTILAVFALVCALIAGCGNLAFAEEAIESAEDEPLEAVEDAEDDELIGARYQWTRISGRTALDTMSAVVRTDGVFADYRGGNVLVATANNYKDALSCAALAGQADAPILITDGKELSQQTADELRRLSPKWVGIVGGKAAVSTHVYAQIKAICPAVERIAGKSAVGTAVKVFKCGDLYSWDRTAIVVTGNGYKDALSIAPYAYWARAPIFLAKSSSNPQNRYLADNVLECIKLLKERRPNGRGLEKVIIVGGTSAVSGYVESQLSRIGVKHVRIWGRTAIDTSEQVAWYALQEGMGLSHVAIATTASYKDALCAVPVCGKQASILLLCNPTGGLSAFDAVCDVAQVEHGHVIGGTSAISRDNFAAITGRGW